MRFTARFRIPSYSWVRRLLLRRLFKRAANKMPPITARKISFAMAGVEIFATELNFKIPALFATLKFLPYRRPGFRLRAGVKFNLLRRYAERAVI